jgi:tetratricopeptide (TPR) repeat protein
MSGRRTFLGFAVLAGTLGLVLAVGCERKSTPSRLAATSQPTVPTTLPADRNGLKAALSAAERRLVDDPNDVTAYVERGRLRHRLSDFEPSLPRAELCRGAWNDFRKAHELAGGTWDFPDPFEALERALRDPSARINMPDARRRGAAHGSVDALLAAEAIALDLEMIPIAAQLVQRAIQIDEHHPRARVRLVAVQALMTDNWKPAVKSLTAMSNEDALRDLPVLWHALAYAQQQVGDTKAAVRSYRHCLELDPGREGAKTCLALMLEGLGEYEESDRLNKEICANNENALFAHNNYAASLNNRGKYQEAVDLLRPVMERNPGFPMGWRNLGVGYAGLGDYGSAVDAFEMFSRVLPQDANGPYDVARTYREWGRLDDALEAFDRSLALDPDAIGTLTESAKTLADLGRYEEAESRFRKAHRQRPDNGFVLSNFGLFLYTQKRYDEARDLLESALRSKSIRLGERLMSVHNLAQLELDVGHPDRAVEIAQSCYREHPDWEGAFNELYAVLDRAGRKEDAAALLDEAQRAHSDWTGPHSWRAKHHLDAGQYEEALADYDRALGIRPSAQDRIHRAFLGWLLGRTADALQDFYAALALSPGEPYACACIWILEKERDRESEGAKVVTDALRRGGLTPWGTMLVRYAAGKITADELVAGATQPGERCEACFYVGEHLRLERGLAEAIPWYEKCVQENQPDYWETKLAQARLDAAK